MTESHLDAVVLGKNHGDKGHSHNNPEYKKHVVGTVRVGIAISLRVCLGVRVCVGVRTRICMLAGYVLEYICWYVCCQDTCWCIY